MRFEIAKSRILETNIDKLQAHLISQCAEYDTKKNGKIDLREMRQVLYDSKMVNLTPFQIQILLGISNPD